MAKTRNRTSGRRASSVASATGLPWVSELQLDAYLQARDALRRARIAASLASRTRQPDTSPTAP
jgi:hypothetical protein